MTAMVTSYSFHGMGITISGGEAVSGVLRSRFRQFSVESLDRASIHFEYCTVRKDEDHVVEKPHGLGRPVVDGFPVEILYFDASDQLYVDYSGRVRVLCDLAGSHVRFSVRDSKENNLWLMSHAAFTLPFAEFMKRSGLYPIHTAALCIEGKGLLFPGHSGAGKSTLTVALLRCGLDFLADDLVFLRNDSDGLKILAFPDEIDLTDQTIDLFPELSHLADVPKSPGWRKRQVRPEEVYPVKLVSECKPGVLIFPRISGNSSSTLKPMDGREALLELLSNIIRTDATSSQGHLNALAALVEQSQCYRLETGRDFDALPGLLRPLVQSQ